MTSEELVRPGLCTQFKQDIPRIKEKLRNKISHLTFREIRRTREDIYVCMEKELVEDGFTNAAAFFRNCVKKEYCLLKSKDGLKVMKLSDRTDLLDMCFKAIKNTEADRGYDLHPKHINAILDAAKAFNEASPDFEWFVEDVLLLGLCESRRIHMDENESQTKVLYCLGNYYFQQQNWSNACDKLELALEFAELKLWSIDNSTDKLLFNAICVLLYQVLIKLAHKICEVKNTKAYVLAERALTIAAKTGGVTHLANAYNYYGELCMHTKQYEKANKMFDQALASYRTEGNLKRICAVELNLSNCLLELSDAQSGRKHIRRSIKIAEKNGFDIELARAYLLMGHIERKYNISATAAENYIKSVEIYNKLGMEKEMRQARCLAAVSLAQEITIPYIETVLKSDKEQFGDNPYTEKLLKWADNREPFWNANDEDLSIADTYFSIHEDETSGDADYKEGYIGPREKSRQSQSLTDAKGLISYMKSSRDSSSMFRNYRDRKLRSSKLLRHQNS